LIQQGGDMGAGQRHGGEACSGKAAGKPIEEKSRVKSRFGEKAAIKHDWARVRAGIDNVQAERFGSAARRKKCDLF
jgi:hypothetical protein